MTPGDFCRIHSGPFAGMTGVVVRLVGEFVVVQLTSGATRLFRQDELALEERTSERGAA